VSPRSPSDSAAASGGRLADAVAELYAAAPQTFTGRRGELAAAARSVGDQAAAKAIGALRRPTRAAWLVNRLARTDPSAPARLAELSGALRTAQQARDGALLRELSAARNALIDTLTAAALAGGDAAAEPPAALRDEVAGTLTAAFADPEAAAAFAAGTLTRAARWSGFGDPQRPADEPAGAVVPLRSASRKDSGHRATSGQSAGRAAPATGADEHAASKARARDAAATAAAATATAQEQLARAAAELAAQRREKYAAAQRGLDAAAALSAEAGQAEDRLEAEVRGLEDRLTVARRELAAARAHARHTEAAQRRARAALDRLPRELPGTGRDGSQPAPVVYLLLCLRNCMTETGQSYRKP
jgi:hypothetical protein